MIRFIAFLSFISLTYGMSCDEIQGVYRQSSCCSGSGSTCLKAIPSCTNTTNGFVCFDGSDIIVKGLQEAMQFTETHITFNRHLKFETTAAFDIGAADSKVRDLYVSESSLWIGDDNKIDVDGGEIKFRKRKKNKVPEVLKNMNNVPPGFITNPENVLPHEWLEILRTNVAGARMQDLYGNDTLDYDTDVLDLLQVRSVNGVPSLEVNGHIVFPSDHVFDIGEIDKTVRNIYYNSTHDHSRIVILGNNPQGLAKGGDWYTDAGAECYDVDNNDVSSNVQVSGQVPTPNGTCGQNYSVFYNCNNITQATRTVTVTCLGEGTDMGGGSGGGGSDGGGLV